MGIGSKLLIVSLVVLISAFLLQEYLEIQSKRSLIAVELECEKTKLSFAGSKEEKFQIEYSQQEWDALVQRISNTRYHSSINVDKFEFGFNVDFAKELAEYWKNTFNWKKQVEILNKYQHYRIKHDDITLHYIRVNGDRAKNGAKRVPLMLLSGWPGSFYEFYKAIELLNSKYNNEERYFDIVVPSIPGYDYSTPLNRKYDVVDTGRLFDGLMRHLFGEETKYFVHGEDWGSIIATGMAKMYPTRVSGIHITMAIIRPGDLRTFGTIIAAELFPSLLLTQEEKDSNITFSLASRIFTLIRESGYFHLQATKPDTVGVGLTDSPLGLMSYILEKYSVWSFDYVKEVLGRHDGSLNEFSKDDLLTIVTIYWMTNSITSSMRYYRCSMTKTSNEWLKYDLDTLPTPKGLPVAITTAPHELDHSPYQVVKRSYTTISQYKILKHGGHFGLFQNPEELIAHLVNFVDNANRN